MPPEIREGLRVVGLRRRPAAEVEIIEPVDDPGELRPRLVLDVPRSMGIAWVGGLATFGVGGDMKLITSSRRLVRAS